MTSFFFPNLPGRAALGVLQPARQFAKRSAAIRTLIFLLQNAYFTRTYKHAGHTDDPAPGADFLAAMVRVKDEARFLPEWIAHHMALGVEHFYVYDNNSADGTREVLSPFISAGVVTYIKWPQVPASPGCYLDFLERFGAACHWVAFFDVDEFLFERYPGATLERLRNATNIPAIAVNWRYFGGAGFKVVPDGLVTQNFNRADAALNDHVKVIARPDQIMRFRNSHNFYYRKGRLARTFQGARVYGSFTRRHEEALVLHHYVYRSVEDYERKVRRGFVDARGGRDQARRWEALESEAVKHNDVLVNPQIEVLDRTKVLLASLNLPEHLYSS